MSETVQMPALGESVTEGTVTQWLKSVGDTVEMDEPLLEVSTDKVDTEIPSPVAGTLQKILVEEDETVEVGTDLCLIGDGDADAAPAEEPKTDESTDTAEPAEESPEETTTEEAPKGSPSGGGSGQSVQMPALGESVTEGTVTQWLKSVGDTVEMDEPLLEVSTDKVDTEIPSPVAGTLQKILVEEDETVEVGTDLCLIGDGDADAAPAEEPKTDESTDTAEPAEESPEETTTEEPSEEPTTEKPSPADTERAPSRRDRALGGEQLYVTPIVRKLAKDKGIDLTEVEGTGIGGRIRKDDVLAAARKAEEAKRAAHSSPKVDSTSAPAPRRASTEPSPLRGTTEKMSRLRQVISARMMESLQSSAQLTTVVEVDVTKVASLRARAKDQFLEREGAKLTFLPFFVKAATEALKAHPKINASVQDKEVVYHDVENIGIAVDTERGLLVPVIKEAGDLTISGIAKKIADLAERTRSSKVGPDELSGSTFTITNTGSGGALFDTPIINQPEVAILGVGTIVKRPMVVRDTDGNETIGIRSMVYLALSYDHRLVDGADAARYLMAVKARLEEGDFAAEIGL
ncbi:MAG: 2-oxoglutarate dehydrogenase, E2 component, dihydrolipoamide succinyltransferase [Bowdeniella nasicola]|nr:2-oxoglutarate dehydrogenase, E2 component, dihydrolipoamide succinyltransferase [Bowdeniella nasicola]